MIGIILNDLPRLYNDGIKINCSDGKQRTGHPVLRGWIANYKEYGTIFQVNNDSYVIYEIPKDAMGSNVKGPVHNATVYKEKYLEFLQVKSSLEMRGLTRAQQQTLQVERDEHIAWFKA